MKMTLTNCTDVPFKFGDSTAMTGGVIASILAILGFSLNSFATVALIYFPKTRRHATTPFVVSLACSDLVFSAVALPMLASKFISRDWNLGTVLCQLFPVEFYGNSAVSLFNLICVTINRWVMIYFPHRSDSVFSRTRSKIIIAFCWIVPVTFLLPSLFGLWGHHALECGPRSCTIMPDEEGRSPKNFFLVLGLGVPGSVLVLTNAAIYKKVYETRRHMERQLQSSSSSSGGGGGGASSGSSRLPKGLREKEQKLTRMMGGIFLVFLLTYMPGVIVKLFDDDIEYPVAHMAAYVVNWVSVIANPLIYVTSQERYREACIYLFISSKDKISHTFSRTSTEGDLEGAAAKDRRAMKLSRLRRGSTFNNSMSEPDDTNRLNQ